MAVNSAELEEIGAIEASGEKSGNFDVGCAGSGRRIAAQGAESGKKIDISAAESGKGEAIV